MSITRTTHRTVTFFHPFHLPGHPRLLPAGEYEIDTLEKLDPDAPTRRYIKLECRVYLWSVKTSSGGAKVHKVTPNALEAAIALDSDPIREDERIRMIKFFGDTPTNDAA